MGNFRIEYKRTVRVRQYETLTIGWMEEFPEGSTTPFEAFEFVKTMVEHFIEEELGELTKKEG